MKQFRNFVPIELSVLLKQLGIVFFLLIISRFLFLIANLSHFSSIGWNEISTGLFVDLMTIGLYYFPYYVLFLLPFQVHHLRWHRVIFSASFHLLTGFILILNLIDCAYFPYTSRRSSADLFRNAGGENHFSQLAGAFLADFWWILLAFLVLLSLSILLYKRVSSPLRNRTKRTKLFSLPLLISFVLVAPFLFLLGRGGVRPKPIGPLEITSMTDRIEDVPFVLNTPFNVLKTIALPGIQEKNYFSIEKEQELFNPIQHSEPLKLLPDSTNVVILILEGFGVEFLGYYGNKSYAPFTDSLLSVSRTYEYGFANGVRSIEALPAILASIPSLTNESYISSPHAYNKIDALPTLLREHGYTSAFFHGATNGSMRFDSFCKIAGVDHYYGRTEYNNDRDFDGTWAIYDHKFNPWAAKKITQLKEPFCSVLFTTSSHHPYKVPDSFLKKVKTGSQEICASISYSDMALRMFFERAKKEPWFENTVFVILADHSPASNTPLYNERTHLFRIPIAFYDPKGRIVPKRVNEVAQQLDILPSILELLNIETDYYAFGKPLFSRGKSNFVAHLSDIHYFVGDKYMLTYYDDQVQNLFNFTFDGVPAKDSLDFYPELAGNLEEQLKAIIQRYHRDLKRNTARATQTK